MPLWVLVVVAAAVGGWAAGRRSGRRARSALGRAAAGVLARAGAIGFSAASAVDEFAPPDVLEVELDRFGTWLQAQWRRSEEERRRLSAVLAGLTEGIVLLDPHGRVLLVNDVARGFWPRLAPGLQGRHQVELFQDARCDRLLAHALARGEAQQADLERPGPKGRWWRLHIVPIPAGEGEAGAALTAGALVIVQDITEQRATEQMRRDFVANVSHELQTPLTSVRGYAETLLDEDDLDPAEIRRFSGYILKESERMAALVRDLLALAQLEAPRWVPAEPVSLGEVARDVVAAQMPFAAERGVALELEAGTLQVPGRPDELRRALENLVRNALAYTPGGGRVRVRVGRLGPEARLQVIDTGIGISAEHLPRLFERFYRVDRGRSRETGGTGLGLAIVKHTAEGHGGRVEVDSVPGEGTTFTLVLPGASG